MVAKSTPSFGIFWSFLEKTFMEEFGRTAYASLELLAEVYLAGEFTEKDVDVVFRTYSEEYIKQAILNAAK